MLVARFQSRHRGDPKKTAGGPPAPDPCGRQSRITEATLAQNPGRKEEAMRGLEKQLEVYRGFVAEARDPAQKLACAAKTAQLMTETATAWHLEAVGAGGVRGTADAKTIELAARLYELVVKTFTQEDFARIDFPRFAREDWPTISKVRYALADLLYFMKGWKRCGPAFDAVVAEDPDVPQAAEASYASVLCYQNTYTEAHPPGNGERADAKNPAPPGLTEAQKAMLAAFGCYVCYLSPAPGERDAYSQYVEVECARARIYFEAERWEEAGWLDKRRRLLAPTSEINAKAQRSRGPKRRRGRRGPDLALLQGSAPRRPRAGFVVCGGAVAATRRRRSDAAS
jgi:hypothetical protein